MPIYILACELCETPRDHDMLVPVMPKVIHVYICSRNLNLKKNEQLNKLNGFFRNKENLKMTRFQIKKMDVLPVSKIRISNYENTIILSTSCLKWPLINRQNKGLKDKW